MIHIAQHTFTHCAAHIAQRTLRSTHCNTTHRARQQPRLPLGDLLLGSYAPTSPSRGSSWRWLTWRWSSWRTISKAAVLYPRMRSRLVSPSTKCASGSFEAASRPTRTASV
eukprot:884898-Prorocentrum_minimum.AAC.1